MFFRELQCSSVGTMVKQFSKGYKRVGPRQRFRPSVGGNQVQFMGPGNGRSMRSSGYHRMWNLRHRALSTFRTNLRLRYNTPVGRVAAVTRLARNRGLGRLRSMGANSLYKEMRKALALEHRMAGRDRAGAHYPRS